MSETINNETETDEKALSALDEILERSYLGCLAFAKRRHQLMGDKADNKYPTLLLVDKLDLKGARGAWMAAMTSDPRSMAFMAAAGMIGGETLDEAVRKTISAATADPCVE